MKPDVQRILAKLSNQKNKLQKVDLSLARAEEAEKFILKNQLAEKELTKKFNAIRVKLKTVVNEAEELEKKFNKAKNVFPVAIKELQDIKSTLKESNISTSEVDKRESVLKTFEKMATNISSKISKIISSNRMR
tara:strand:- start:275 stop:676 length:402 start_codon:yes stop_codon:yes gene_type:complete